MTTFFSILFLTIFIGYIPRLIAAIAGKMQGGAFMVLFWAFSGAMVAWLQGWIR